MNCFQTENYSTILPLSYWSTEDTEAYLPNKGKENIIMTSGAIFSLKEKAFQDLVFSFSPLLVIKE
jgi:hypothetical protein